MFTDNKKILMEQRQFIRFKNLSSLREGLPVMMEGASVFIPLYIFMVHQVATQVRCSWAP